MILLLVSVLLTGALALPSARIVNGQDSEHGQWPWQVSLQYSSDNSKPFSHICGGSLIDRNWVLTAAHCVEFDGNFGNFRVVLGEHQLTVDHGPEQTVNILNIIMHQNYDGLGSGIPNDIALLRLAEPADTSIDEISLVSLPNDPNQQFSSTDTCYISGWGKTSVDTGVSDILQHVQIKVMTNSNCRWSWLLQTILDTHICVGGGTESACNGDSGGPLVCLKNGVPILAGVTSWGSSNCQNRPNVYTRVSKYLEWISKNSY